MRFSDTVADPDFLAHGGADERADSAADAVAHANADYYPFADFFPHLHEHGAVYLDGPRQLRLVGQLPIILQQFRVVHDHTFGQRPRLLVCDFESSDLCGFTNGDYAWTRDAYGTPSYNTGPSGDHTTGAGYYMHVETSGAYGNPPYTLTSPTFSECVGEVRFAYHMYGSAMGTLKLDVYDSGTAAWSTSWSLSGNQG